MSPEAIVHLFEMATRNHQKGHLKEAETTYRTVLQFQPDHAFCLQQFAMLLAQLGRHKEAVPFMERSVRIRGDIPAFWNNLGEIYRQVNRLVESMQAFHKALRLQHLFPEAHYNLANVLKLVGRHGEAVTHYQESVRLKPDYDRAWYNLGNTLREEGRIVPAISAYREAIRLKPDWADAHLNFANALYDQRDLENAAAEYRRAAELKPEDADLDDSLGNCLVAAGKTEEAKTIYRKAATRRPGKWLRELRCDLLAPPVAPNAAFIDEYRQSIPSILERYVERGSIELADLHSSGAEPPMLLAYHGRDDRLIKEQFSRFFRQRLPQFDPPERNKGKPSVGVVVTHGHEGVFARCLGELIAKLDRNRLDVKLITSRSGANVLRFMQPNADFEYVLLPDRVDQAHELLREIGFDVLLYWEIGTDSMNYFLPLFQPARVQATSWGWPVTSGHRVVSDFLSWSDLEPPDADAHYVERLVRFSRLPSYYIRPPLPHAPRSKDAFGFSNHQHVYLCQQNVRKYHHEFDGILAEILRTDPVGAIGIIADEQPAITELLMQRLRESMPDVSDRLRVIPRLERAEYLELVAASDVILDTPHYGGGANTVLDAVAAGTPIVTWPGLFHRGRWAAALNQMIGVAELNATTMEDYPHIAVQITTDNDRQRSLKKRIINGGHELFESIATVHEWEEWLIGAAARARAD